MCCMRFKVRLAAKAKRSPTVTTELHPLAPPPPPAASLEVGRVLCMLLLRCAANGCVYAALRWVVLR